MFIQTGHYMIVFNGNLITTRHNLLIVYCSCARRVHLYSSVTDPKHKATNLLYLK